MKTKFIILSAIIASFIFASCSDDLSGKSKKPSFQEIELSQNPCSPGDTVLATINYKDKGDYFYFYTQVIYLNDSTVYKNDSHTTDLPKNVKIIAPKNAGNYTVKFYTKLSYTSGTTLFDQTDPITKTLKVVQKEEEE